MHDLARLDSMTTSIAHDLAGSGANPERVELYRVMTNAVMMAAPMVGFNEKKLSAFFAEAAPIIMRKIDAHVRAEVRAALAA